MCAQAMTYRERIDAAVGERDPLELMRETPGLLEQIVREHSLDVLRARAFEGKWTPCEILGHLADAELMFGSRLRLMLWEHEPVLPGWDQDRWAAAQKQNDVEPEQWVMRFRVLREMNLSVWRLVREDDLSRAGVHTERGRETLADLRQMTAGHDLLHIEQLERYIAAIVETLRRSRSGHVVPTT